MDFKFHTHNIHLFAYYFSENVDSLGDYKQHWLWDKCDELVAKTLKPKFEFSIEEHLHLENKHEEPWANLNRHFSNTDDYHPIYVQHHGCFTDKNGEKIDSSRKTSIIYPVQMYDSYGIGFQLINPKNETTKPINSSDIALANPNNCLILDVNQENEYFLGQTLLVTIKLENRQQLKQKRNKVKLKKIADKYIESLFPDTFRKPPFNRSGNLFGSPVFEYGIIRESKSYNHIIICFIGDDNSEDKLNKNYPQLLDLFLFRSKIIHAYRQVKKIEKEGKNKSREIQLGIRRSQEFTDSELDLKTLHELLVKLPNLLDEYAGKIRFIKEYQNIIVDYQQNYSDKIHEIKSDFPEENFSFLEMFTERACHPFQKRVAATVQFFQLDASLINNGIDSIKSQLAIEQARRERELQARITGLSIGLAAAGTVAGNLASSYEATAIAIPDENSKSHDWSHFGLSLLISTAGGLFVALIATLMFTKMNRILLHRLQLFVRSRRKY
ncbi:hypothetical protein NIES267_56890 [Calothrix parasitica NIES-267]|uniref:Uncharacterized protein n=1 Tax=Calothrix parasitica NIES-267 TaxID=1973488 RepID=A0A1Z4LY86_9CYAN|nr:hypothetical protein NIES267_56890 [Calothrix parasitica NIES-267]